MKRYVPHTTYFLKEGKENLPRCLELSFERARATRVSHIVIFTANGEGIELACNRYLRNESYSNIRVIGVSFPYGRISSEALVIPQDRLALFAEFNIPILRSFNPLEGPPLPDEDEGGQIRRTLQLFSGGTHLCVRGVLTACDAGYVSLGEHVITMCADTSLIVKGAPTAKFFSAFIVREFVCKPLVLDISHGEVLPAELDIDAMAKEARTVDQIPQKFLETPDKEKKA